MWEEIIVPPKIQGRKEIRSGQHMVVEEDLRNFEVDMIGKQV